MDDKLSHAILLVKAFLNHRLRYYIKYLWNYIQVEQWVDSYKVFRLKFLKRLWDTLYLRSEISWETREWHSCESEWRMLLWWCHLLSLLFHFWQFCFTIRVSLFTPHPSVNVSCCFLGCHFQTDIKKTLVFFSLCFLSNYLLVASEWPSH
jgi:hypothetical protein